MRSTRQQPRSERPIVREVRRGPESAAVLLEVIVALSLFVFAAAIISNSMTMAVDRTLRLHEQAHALDLAISVLAEVELGIRPNQPAGPDVFEPPFEGWTWQIETVPYSLGGSEVTGLHHVTVIIRNAGNTTVQRLTQLLPTAAGPPLVEWVAPPTPGGRELRASLP